jgi:hypothetical protein
MQSGLEVAMTDKVTFQDVSNMNERIIGNYFQSRGFTLKRLDEGKGEDAPRACEWLVQSHAASFFCEVKTVTSVQRGVRAQADFRKEFENPVKERFREKDVRGLPYHVHFHSDTLSVPDREQLKYFLEWLVNTIRTIHAKGEHHPGSLWILDKSLNVSDEIISNCLAAFSVAISKPILGCDHLEYEVSTYGGLNSRRVKKDISDAVKQLRKSGQKHPTIARVVIMAFAGRIHLGNSSQVAVFHGLTYIEEELWHDLDSLLPRYPSLSAIAVMVRQNNPYFWVYHNPAVKTVNPLNREIFEDGTSVQFDSLDSIPRVTAEPLDLERLIATFLDCDGEVITTHDYEALRARKEAG